MCSGPPSPIFTDMANFLKTGVLYTVPVKFRLFTIGEFFFKIYKLKFSPYVLPFSSSGYAPADYESEKDWETRLKIELSRAIKCPNIAYHLAGTKKVQYKYSKF